MTVAQHIVSASSFMADSLFGTSAEKCTKLQSLPLVEIVPAAPGMCESCAIKPWVITELGSGIRFCIDCHNAEGEMPGEVEPECSHPDAQIVRGAGGYVCRSCGDRVASADVYVGVTF